MWLMCIYSYSYIELLTFSSHCYRCCGKYIGVVLIWAVMVSVIIIWAVTYIMMQTKFWLVGTLTEERV